MTKRQWLLSFCCAGMMLGCSENGTEMSVNCPGGCNEDPASECEKPQKDCREDGADAAVCVDVRNDHNHCGDCHSPCKSNETCLSGTCTKKEDLPECGELSPCVLEDGSYACFDLNVDRDHCGRCETFCNDGENCINGTCKGAENTSCANGLSACPVGDGEQCFDLLTDGMHCGRCDIACGADETCVSGSCEPLGDNPCNEGETPCPANDGSVCANLQTDTAHCGKCEIACNDGESCVSGVCKPAEVTCSANEKLCSAGDQKACVDVIGDNANCGDCGVKCGDLQTCQAGSCKPATSFTLRTKNATLGLSLSGNDILVNSLKSVGGKEYLPASQALTLPDCGDTLKYQSVERYSRGRTMDGLKFHYTGSALDYDLYIVSSESFSGPFEFYGYLTNKGEKRRVTPGNYFNLAVKFPAVPTATVFHKESGSAEGWKLYNGTAYGGSGIYHTSLGKVGSSNTASSAKIPRSDYSAIYFWTGLKDTSEHVITFYARGKQGESFNYDYEAAHANINGTWTPAVEYGVSGSYTFKNSDVWEPVTLHLTSNYPAGSKDGKVWNEEHANRGFPFRIYTTQANGNPFWIDEVTINGRTQSFNGNTPDEGWEWGSWTPSNNINIDKSMGYVDATSGYASAIAAYTTNQDWNAGGDISMMYLDTNESGLYFAQEWSNGRLTASGADGNQAYLNALIGNGDFSTSLDKGQVLYLPSIYIGVYDGDIDIGSNHFKRWFLNCKAPENMMKDANEPLTQQDMQIGYDVSQYGIQSIKWDYGWWSDEAVGNWKSHEGLLEVNNSAYKAVLSDAGAANLGEFVNKAKSKGVTLATYILLKDTKMDRAGVPTSVGANGHPEWFSDRVVTVGASADLGNTDCVAFYKKYLSDFFSSTGVTTWRSDFEPIARSSNKANRHDANGTDVQYWCTVGFGELVDHLIQNIPGFRYESCSSGGSMKDLFTMTKASVLNCDDSADYMSLHMTFYDSSYCIHPAQLQLPINSLTYTPGSEYYTGSADYMYGLRAQMTGGVMLSNWKGTNNGGIDETSHWKTTIAVDYNTKLKPLIRNGDLYHILGRPDGKNWDGLEYVDLNAPTYVAAVMLWKPAGAGASMTVKLRGLNADAKYKLNFTDHTGLNTTKTGKELMESGLSVNFAEAVSSDIIYLTRE